MAQNSLSILLQTNSSAKDTLAEEWGKVIENLQKKQLHHNLKIKIYQRPSVGC